MLIPVLLFIVGLLCLIKGGDWFVDGATGIARRFHVPELLIGATVVSIGTTLPEVMVSTTSALTGHGEIAYGNAIGSVICNAALIAAITIAVRPGKVDGAYLPQRQKSDQGRINPIFSLALLLENRYNILWIKGSKGRTLVEKRVRCAAATPPAEMPDAVPDA